MQMTEAQQSKSLTTGQDVRQKRSLTYTAAQPNKKREAGHLWSNICVIAFCIAGLVLTIQGKHRGDEYWFKLAFSICIGISGAEVVLNIILMIVSNRCSNDNNEEGGRCKQCGTACLSILINMIYIIGCGVCFGFLVYSLILTKGIEAKEECGCVNNYGCANIMAIIACILYGGRLLAILICLPCLICATCCVCCAAVCCSKDTSSA